MLRNSGKLVGRLITASGTKSFPVAALELSGAGSSVFFAQLTALSRCLAEGCPGGVAVRAIASTSAAQSGEPTPKTHEERRRQARASAVAVGKEDSSITDQIPLYSKPVGKAEATSYTLLIFAGLTFAGVVLYNAVNELIFQPPEYMAFNRTLDMLREDPRVTVRLGSPISGYGQDSRNRVARQRIPHRVYTDDGNREHIQIQFFIKGPANTQAQVHADMFRESKGAEWNYTYVYVDVRDPRPQRINIISPQYS